MIVVAIVTALVLSTSGPPAPTPNPPSTFAFGALGDAPYYPWEDWHYPLVLDQESRRRLEAALAWFHETFARAKSQSATAVVVGDSHHFRTDHPLKARASKQTIGNVARLEVPGSPLVGWVRVVVIPGATPSSAFEQRLVPRWKYW